ncbi:MAG: hypothetical protein L6244_04660 [Candidatus Methanoperedenaceae archaeon]|nr:hypothetical protein [Candidatus Methanoperedenaceae archaeon]
MTNKTAIKEYYAHGFEGFFGALAKNKKKLKGVYQEKNIMRSQNRERQ